VEIFLRFHSTCTLTNGFRRYTMTDGRRIAHFYVFRGTFFWDVLAVLPTLLAPVALISDWRLFRTLIRLLRLVRLYRRVHEPRRLVDVDLSL